MATANEIRRKFLDHFRVADHEIVASSPLVPRNDPTLLFTNSGMVQFKNLFTGVERRAYRRAATAQKCIRAGGKHNDLENVGHTARHHTFFEMLGNFSFGDYFKERAISLAWDLITREFGIDRERLLVTVYADDDEAGELWRKIAGLPDDRIIRIATSDNFWAMGDTGPCGPCSEIFFDHGPAIAGGPPGSADADGDRFIEIWNLVFMQFEQRGPGDRVALPSPSIDTGMGLERVAALLQGVHDNYDTDLLRGLILASADASGVEPDGPHRVSHRVVADHLRSAAFLVAEGVLPSNEGRGYVLRRIMRRAMRHAHLMGCRAPLLCRLVPALVRAMGQDYPELARAEPLIAETLRREEVRFAETLERGLRLLADETERLGDGITLPGRIAFTLYDTYGFPLDLTQDVLRAQGRAVDTDGFAVAMAEQRAAARAAWAGSGEAAAESVWFEVRERVGATEFLGYATEAAEGQVLALVVDGAPVASAEDGVDLAVIVNQTPFYGESGGQAGDQGEIRLAGGARVAVHDTRKQAGDLVVHHGRLSGGRATVGEAAHLEIDHLRRSKLRAHHSVTHLLHEALRRTLGDHVAQKGSLVEADRMRFDFSHPKPITADERARVEDEVNRQIRANAAVETRLMSPDEATAAGALALFGEKYGEEVRVVAMGGDGDGFSVELCGGTHVARVGDIGFFRIVQESAVASGVRRIEAVAGAPAGRWIAERDGLLDQTAAVLKVAAGEVPERVKALVEERRRLEKELLDARKALAMAGGAGATAVAAPIRAVNGVPLTVRLVEGVPARELKGMAETVARDAGSGVVVIAATEEGRASLVVAVSADFTARVDAVRLVRAGAQAVGGKGGGGRADMAQAGGPDGARLADAIAAIEAELAA